MTLGATYQEKNGNATGTVKKTDKGIEFTANCDSLNILIEQLTKEVYRFQSENSALVTKLNEQKVTELSGWQKLRLNLFPISALINLVLIVIIFNKYNIWQKVRQILIKLIR